jgi:hypothetical protein
MKHTKELGNLPVNISDDGEGDLNARLLFDVHHPSNVGKDVIYA